MGRVLFVSSIKRYGGGERWMLDAAGGLARRGHSVLIVSRPGSILEEKRRKLGIDGKTIEMHGDLDPVAITRMSMLIRHFEPDVICANLDREIRICGISLLLTGNILRKRIGAGKRRIRLIPRRGSEFPLKNNFHYKYFYTRFVDSVIVNSRATLHTMLSKTRWFSPEKAVIMYNGIDFCGYDDLRVQREKIRGAFRRSLGLSSQAVLVTLVGELSERKGHRFIIESADELIKRFPEVRFIFAGEGDAREAIENLLRKKGTRSYFHLLGFREDIPVILTASDVLVLPSLVEGFGYVLLEAMAAELPVVASKASSIPEIVQEGSTGFLHEVGDSGGIAALVGSLLGDGNKAQIMGRAGLIRAKQDFGLEQMLDKLEELFFSR
jgi:glycosyltransferase involved in cell wall biosynthesis